jgi:hypothetical protein
VPAVFVPAGRGSTATASSPMADPPKKKNDSTRAR